MARADVWVYATPLYVDGMTGPMKMFLDRMIPGALPFFEMRDGHNRHPGRGNRQGGKIVLVSSCGFWELDNFDALVTHMKAYCKNANREFAGALLRPHAGALGPMVQAGIATDVVVAAKEAGRQMVTTGNIQDDTLGVVRRELLPMQTYFEMANRGFKQRLDDNTKP
jgi:multimeric flavodoxin WrbA